jgi:hypothetical protein
MKEWFIRKFTPKNIWKVFGIFIGSIVLFFLLVRIGVFGKLPYFD